MHNYEYIVASLPNLTLDFKSGDFDYRALAEEVKSLCSRKDGHLVDLLETGIDGEENCPSRFLREYFDFDRNFRSAKVAFLEGRPFDKAFEPVFSESNLIEREKKIDGLYWKKAGESVVFDVFTFDLILSLLAKAKIVARWRALDQAAGESFFRTLVNEVRGTYKGIEIEDK